jgi:hypothetical protein
MLPLALVLLPPFTMLTISLLLLPLSLLASPTTSRPHFPIIPDLLDSPHTVAPKSEQLKTWTGGFGMTVTEIDDTAGLKVRNPVQQQTSMKTMEDTEEDSETSVTEESSTDGEYDIEEIQPIKKSKFRGFIGKVGKIRYDDYLEPVVDLFDSLPPIIEAESVVDSVTKERSEMSGRRGSF